ncbi:hypothetical protein D3C76_906210 [compost metagenome]
MLYLIFDQLNPLVPVLFICPLIAIVIGVIWALRRINVIWGICIAVMLPLLFTTQDMGTFKANLDAWALYGIIYSLITFAVIKVMNKYRR